MTVISGIFLAPSLAAGAGSDVHNLFASMQLDTGEEAMPPRTLHASTSPTHHPTGALQEFLFYMYVHAATISIPSIHTAENV